MNTSIHEEKKDKNSPRYPYHPSFPEENVFSGKDVRSAIRVTTLLENHLLTGLRFAQMFKPKPTDVLLISAPCCGEDLLGRIVGLLLCENQKELLDYDQKWNIPWIEGRTMNSRRQDLDETFFCDRRILRTQMAMTLLSPRFNIGPKYLILLRNPIDMRARFYEYLKFCYQMNDSGEEEKQSSPPIYSFNGLFPSADSFVHVPISLCQLNTLDADSYEQFVSDWYRETRTNSDTLLIFYEGLISNPQREIRRIFNFLKSPSASPATTISKKKQADGTSAFQCSNNLTQDDEDRINKTIAACNLDQMDVKEKRKSTKARPNLNLNGASDLTVGFDGKGPDGFEGLGASYYESILALASIQTFWEKKFGAFPGTYEVLYESEMKEKYPYPQQVLPKQQQQVPPQSPLSFETVGRVMSVAKARISTLSTVVAKNSDSFIRSSSKRFSTQIKRSGFMNEVSTVTDDDSIETPSIREHSGSMLPSEAFGDNNTWSTMSSTQNPIFASFGGRNHPHEVIENDEEIEEGSENEDWKTVIDNKSVSSYKMSNASSQYSVTSKFASQQIFESNMLRSTLKQAGVKKEIVDAVVNEEQLSEML